MKTQSQEDLLNKSVIEANDLASAGELNAEEAEKFLDYVIDETALKSSARVIKIRKGDKWRVNKIGVGRRNAVRAEAGVDPGIRRGITTAAVDLETQEIMVPFDIGDGFLERNIEGLSVREHIVRMMGVATANDSEELWLLGDTLGHARLQGDLEEGGDDSRYILDDYMTSFNGLLRLADSGHIVDSENANFSVSTSRQAVTAMPTKFRRNRNDLRLYTPTDLLEIWRERVSTRVGPEGLQALSGGNAPKPFGLTPADLALLPFQPLNVEHITLNGTTPVSLRYGPVQNVVVTTSTITKNKPEDAYVETTDYTVDYTNGVVTRNGAGSIGDGDTVKVTYESNPQLIVTHKNNIIIAISRDVRIERARNIHRRVSEYVITTKIAIGVEETDALVKVTNVGTGV
jgi:hypothetical protein